MSYLANVEVVGSSIVVTNPVDGTKSVVNQSYLNYTPNNNTIGYYPFNIDWLDKGPLGNNFTDTAVSGSTSPIISTTAGKWTGTGALRVQNSWQGVSQMLWIDKSLITDLNTSWTFSCWVKPTPGSCDSATFIMGYGGDHGVNIGFGQRNNQTNKWDGTSIGNDDTGNMLEVWYHIAVVHTVNSTKLFTNGVLSQNSPYATSLSSNYPGWTTIGKPIDQSSTSGNYFGGYMQELIIENKAWTNAEVVDYYNARK